MPCEKNSECFIADCGTVLVKSGGGYEVRCLGDIAGGGGQMTPEQIKVFDRTSSGGTEPRTPPMQVDDSGRLITKKW